MARSWVGLTILACLPCMMLLRSSAVHNSYANCSLTRECYRSVRVSSQIVGQTRLPPPLRHKAYFAYEYIPAHAITCRDMHVHAVLSSKEDSILSMTEERMSRWPHRPDV